MVLGLLLSGNANAGDREGRFYFEYAKHVKGTTVYKGSSTKFEYAKEAALMQCRSREPYAKSDPDGCMIVDLDQEGFEKANKRKTAEEKKRIAEEEKKRIAEEKKKAEEKRIAEEKAKAEEYERLEAKYRKKCKI